MMLTAYYRLYDLPWSPTEETERRFRRVLRNALILFVLVAILIPLLPVPDKSRVRTPAVPDRIVKLVIEKQSAPPPPPPPQVEDKKPEPVKPPPQPRSQPQPSARQRAQNTGLLQLQDQLADLRDHAAFEKAAQARELTGAVGETRSERAMITSKVGGGSGGINTAALSRGYGGGAGALAGHATTQVSAPQLASAANGAVRRTSGSDKAPRSEEEIALVFDRNKGAIYALYTRALRDKPDLQGKLVLELTIAPDGQITRCEVVSSELNDPELERKLIARVKLFRFEARDVAPITVTKPIDFFPA